MTKHKFKNPKVNNQYKKPACHTDHCFQRHACCNNYRCCVCHCCLEEYQVYSKVHDRCVGNLTQVRVGRERVVTTMHQPTTTKRAVSMQMTEESVTLESTINRQTTQKNVWLETTIQPQRRSRQINTTKMVPTRTTDVTATWRPWKPTIESAESQGKVGYQNKNRDDKTSTIAGVAVALGLVAIVAVVILVIVCSRRKKRNQSKAAKANTSNTDAAVVTIPLTIENVPDKYRDTEEGTTSDTTIDSPIAVTVQPNGTPSGGHPVTNGNQLIPTTSTSGKKKQGKNTRRWKHAKENGTAEQKRLFKEPASTSNGTAHHIPSDQASHVDKSQGPCLNNHACLGAGEKRGENGHSQSRNSSLSCDV